ncbi:MAG TPA: response regulator [Acidimicrobiales bacterium]|nr:response regulator [Acidimicrobiales bacterium]
MSPGGLEVGEAVASIMVVDDTPSSVRLLSGILEAQGYKIVEASSGEDALERIEAGPPDLLLLDYLMPGIDGEQVCVRLREDPRTCYLPVIMLTSAGNEEKVRALEAGAVDFLSKPVDRAQLLARVRSLLRIKRYHDRVEAQAAELSSLNVGLESRVAEKVEEVARLSRLRRFMPPGLADLVTSSDERWLLDTHRTEVAVLFADLRGFTAFAHGAEPEDVMAVLRSFHRCAGDCAARHQATVGWLSGDGLMVFFNDPLPCKDPAGSAISMAVDLRGDVDRLVSDWQDEGHDLGMGIGIALGYATLGVLGAGERVEYSPVGSVVNLAARLCDHAREGEIILSQSVHFASGPAIDAERVGPLELHGFPTPVSAWRLVRTTGETSLAAIATRQRPARLAVNETSPPSSEAHEDAFLRDGNDWAVTFRARTVRLRDSKGVAYIAVLLGSEGKEVHVAELAGLGRSESASLGRDVGPVIDTKARQAYQARAEELRAERDEARDWGDLERAARAEEELWFLTHELSAAYGLGGRPRRADDPSERIRKAVTNRIRQSMVKIEAVHAELGRHLSNSVHTGTFCSYMPEAPVRWKL